jgi:hypothetical protein
MHTLSATQRKQYYPSVTGTSGASTLAVAVYPDAPDLTVQRYAVALAPVPVTGRGTAGDTVTLYDAARAIGTALVQADGTWSLSVSFTAGTHSLSAVQTTPGTVRLTSDPGDAATITVYAPAAAPAVTSPASSLPTVTLTGTGVAGYGVVVTENGVSWTTTVAANGTWSLTIPGQLAVGTHSFSVKQVEPSSGATSATTATSVRVYAVPAAPLLSAPLSVVTTKTSAAVTVGGTGTAGETITIYDNGIALKTVVLTTSGAWTTTLTLALGAHPLTATRTVAPGITSAAGPAVTVTVAR